MNTTTTLIKAPGAKRILAAYNDATEAGQTAVQKALYCGQLLREQQVSMANGCHDGNHFQHCGRGGRPEAQQFTVWLAKECPEIAERTAYRWMRAAERTDKVLQLSDAIDIEATPLSELLSGSSTHKARQLWLDFTQDKTLAECLRDVVDGESPDHRIARVYNGKNSAGAGGSGDRKQFEKFAAIKLQHLTTFLRAKLAMNQKALILAAFNHALEIWPRWMLEALADKCRTELKLSDAERDLRKEF